MTLRSASWDTVRGDLLSLEERLRKGIGGAATELAKAFFHFTESNHIRATQLEANQATLIARISTLEARLTDLESASISPTYPPTKNRNELVAPAVLAAGV